MTCITKFNKQILDLYSHVIQEFIDKLKINIPDDYHTLMDEQFKKVIAVIQVIQLNIENTKKPTKTKAIAPKKAKKIPKRQKTQDNDHDNSISNELSQY